jgi:hypothetical protein
MDSDKGEFVLLATHLRDCASKHEYHAEAKKDSTSEFSFHVTDFLSLFALGDACINKSFWGLSLK